MDPQKKRLPASWWNKIIFVKNPPKSHKNLQKLNKIIKGFEVATKFFLKNPHQVNKTKLSVISQIMADKLFYIPNDKQNYPFCRLQLLVETFEH